MRLVYRLRKLGFRLQVLGFRLSEASENLATVRIET